MIAGLERVFGVPFIDAYGMTEAAPQIASNRLTGERKIGSVGRAAGPDVAIMDEAGSRLPPEETGEIVIRGTNVMQAYENNAEASQSAFVDGWLRTGDLATWMKTATCSSPAVSKRSSTGAARRSRPGKWTKFFWTIPRSRKPLRSRFLIRRWAKVLRPRSSSRRNMPVSETEIRAILLLRAWRISKY